MYANGSYSGYCPQRHDTYTIDIEYASVSLLGNNNTAYKKMGFDCPYIDDCEHLDNHGRCPLFIEAPNHP